MLQARVSHQQAQRAVSEAENSRDLAKSQLAVTLDYLPDPTFTNETATAGKLAAPSLREAIQAARQQREEIQVTQLTWHRTQAERDEIRARFAPTMDLQLGSDVSTGSTLDRRDSWNAGISFSWAIFDRGQRLLDLKTNDLQLAQDDLQIQEASRTVSHDVVDAWYSVEKFRIRMESLVLERKAAEANYEVQEGKYKAGLATALEVQTALRDLARVRIENVGARFDLEIAYRDLENMLAQYETPRLTETVSRMTAARPASPLIILKNSTPNTKAP